MCQYQKEIISFQKQHIKAKKQYRNYTPEALYKAYESVRDEGKSVKLAAKQYQVPVQTLRDRVKGKINPNEFSNGGDVLFTKEEEEGVVEHVEVLGELGYGVTNSQLQNLAGELAFNLGKRPTSKKLSNCWLYGFRQRWDDRIRPIKPSALDANRAKSTTPVVLSSYFQNLEKVIQDNDLKDKPHLIYNIDETGIQPEHRPANIIAPVGQKAHSITSPRGTTTTIIAAGNASGQFIPPYFVFKGKRWNPDRMLR